MFALHLGAKTSSNLAMIKQTRAVVDELNTKFGGDVAFMYGFPFLFFEQYLHSYRDLNLVVGLALGECILALLHSSFIVHELWYVYGDTCSCLRLLGFPQFQDPLFEVYLHRLLTLL